LPFVSREQTPRKKYNAPLSRYIASADLERALVWQKIAQGIFNFF
jgi:hypothetical protein